MSKEPAMEGQDSNLSGLKSLGGFASKVRDQERERIARELHDGVLQSLVALKLELEIILDLVAGEVAKDIRQSIEHLQDEIHEIRSLIYSDIPDYLLGKTPAMAAATAVDRFKQYHPTVAVEIETRVTSDIVDLEATWAVYRILQESLTNAATHGQATEVSVSLVSRGVLLELVVSDNGIGMVANDANIRVGLNNIRWRAESLGGSVLLDSQSGSGTTIRARLPAISRRRPVGAGKSA